MASSPAGPSRMPPPQKLLTRLQSSSRPTKLAAARKRPLPPGADDEHAAAPRGPLRRERDAIRIRLVTWNLADSLPTRDLSELLGEVDEHAEDGAEGSSADLDDGEIPHLGRGTGHPYHLIVVAAQECPMASGIVNGRLPRNLTGKGWTSLLEEWLCAAPSPTHAAPDSDSDGESTDGGHLPDNGHAAARALEEMKRKRRHYTLMSKERLLPGLFLAVFCATSCTHLVRGLSSARVPAGLMNGRIGNKGGVATSIDFAGKRLLFISVHLAAHASRYQERVENLKRIFLNLREGEIDDFCPDPSARAGPEVLKTSERWDQVFLMGDMNFRLDISRKHADWLLKTKDFQTALQFDQLRRTMGDPGSILSTFSEGRIDFPPTYKYDVPKHKKEKVKRPLLLRAMSARPAHSRENVGAIPASPTAIPTSPTAVPPSPMSITHAALGSPPGAPATLPTSISKTSSTDFAVEKLAPNLLGLGLGDGGIPGTRRVSSREDSDGASIASSRGSLSSNLSDYDFESFPPSTESSPAQASLSPPMFPGAERRDRNALKRVSVKLMRMVKRKERRSSLRAAEESDDAVDDVSVAEPVEEKAEMGAVFDSSAKQRVQSYTDRILFKTNVHLASNAPSPPPTTSRTLSSTIVDSFKGIKNARVVPLRDYIDYSPSSTPITSSFPSPILAPPITPIQEGVEVEESKPSGKFGGFFGSKPLTQVRSHESERSIPHILQTDGPASLQRTTSLVQFSDVRRTASGGDGASRPFWKRASSGSKRRASLGMQDEEERKAAEANQKRRQSDTSFGAGGKSTLPERSKTQPVAPLPSPSDPVRSVSSTIRSFFHLPLPSFLSFSPHPVVPPPPSPPAVVEAPPKLQRTGPRRGEILVLQYTSVNDLERMGATSDHRPVIAVVEVGIEDEEEEEEQ